MSNTDYFLRYLTTVYKLQRLYNVQWERDGKMMMMMKKDDYLRYYKKENKCYIYSILGAKSI
jgi:hypothetical protein